MFLRKMFEKKSKQLFKTVYFILLNIDGETDFVSK